MLAGGAGSAFATDGVEPGVGDDTNLLLSVVCGDGQPGALSMDVDNSDVRMAEVAAGVTGQRWFDGQLGDVVIRDTRCPLDLEEGAWWWVEGVATDFVAQDVANSDIDVDYLGWEPSLVDDNLYGVSAGEEIGSILDSLPFTSPAPDPNRGLGGGQEFLASMTDAADPEYIAVDEWTASAKMKLKALDTIDDGDYVSVLTLTLMEYPEPQSPDPDPGP